MARGPRKKKLLYDFFIFIYFFMYIRNDVNRWTPLSKKPRSATVTKPLSRSIFGYAPN